MLKPAVIARTGHKWLALLVGLQLLIWLVTGLYMVVVDLDRGIPTEFGRQGERRFLHAERG